MLKSSYRTILVTAIRHLLWPGSLGCGSISSWPQPQAALGNMGCISGLSGQKF